MDHIFDWPLALGLLLGYLVYLSFKYYKRHGLRKTMLQKGFSFKKRANIDGNTIYYRHKGIFHSLDFGGDEIRTPYFTDKDGKELNLFAGIKHELIAGTLTSDSQVPSLSYPISVGIVQMKSDDDRGDPLTLQVFFRPTDGVAGQWVVSKITSYGIVLTHPVMGELLLPKPRRKFPKLGDSLTLVSKVVETGYDHYLLTYKIVD